MAHDSENDNVRQQIDENLKRVFQQRSEEELPDRFKQLLEQLKSQEKNGGSK